MSASESPAAPGTTETPRITRRGMLTGIMTGAAGIAVSSVAGCSTNTAASPHSARRHLTTGTTPTTPSHTVTSAPSTSRPQGGKRAGTHPASAHPAFLRLTHLPAPPMGVLGAVPSDRTHRQIALTVDDGIMTTDVRAYALMARQTGLRLTFFANGCYASWKTNQKLIAPMVESGQIVVGNHTYSHPDIRTLSDAELKDQIIKNQKIIKNLFGVSPQPFFRPPYGSYDARTLHILHDLGYTVPVMWYGTLGDDQDISTSQIIANAKKYYEPGRLVIGHANHPGTQHAVSALHQIITQRKLTTVTLRDILPSVHKQ